MPAQGNALEIECRRTGQPCKGDTTRFDGFALTGNAVKDFLLEKLGFT